MEPIEWVYLAILVISIYLAVKASKRNDAKPASLADFNVPTAEDGRPVSMCFGDVWISDQNFLDYGNLRTYPIKATGGK